MADFRLHPDPALKEPVWRNADRFRAGSAEDHSTYRECMPEGVQLKPP